MPYTADPATKTLAPASAARVMVSSVMPPSTWMATFTPEPSTAARARRIFGSITSRNAWPPKPGSTVMISSMSSSESMSRYGSTGVAGRSAMPAFAPRARSSRASLMGASDASTWNVTELRPASAYCGAQRSTLAIIRWASKRDGADLLQPFHYRQADGQIRHKVVVHNIHVHGIGVADAGELGLEVDEVGREDAGVNAAVQG